MTDSVLCQLNYSSLLCRIQAHTLIRVWGKDVKTFLQGQFTNDVNNLVNGQAQINSRLTLKGRVQSFFSLGQDNSNFYIFIDSRCTQGLMKELSKYIIREDVQFEVIEEGEFIVRTGALAAAYSPQIPVHYLGFQGHLTQDKKGHIYLEKDLREAIVYSGFPLWGKTIKETDLVNETILDRYGISYEKGCFFGQETPSKINSGRGGNYFPCLIKLENAQGRDLGGEGFVGENLFVESEKIGTVMDYLEEKKILYCRIKRSYRIQGKELSFRIQNDHFKEQLMAFPAMGWMNGQELSHHLFLEGARRYAQEDNAEDAIGLLREAIRLNNKNADAYEALGVILGHQERYSDAIELMNTLGQISPDSIMSHTNRSLFYMKKGDIKKAEDHKAEATVLGMKRAGREAKKSKEKQIVQKEKEQQLVKRENMYRQVLLIDPDDSFAHYSLASLYFEQNKIKKSIEHVRKTLKSDQKYSLAYLLLGKALESCGQGEEAKSVYETGKRIAANQGEIALANEMQVKFSKL